MKDRRKNKKGRKGARRPILETYPESEIKIDTGAQAHAAKLAAQKIRHKVQTMPDYNPAINRMDMESADRLEEAANKALVLPEEPYRGAGGELVPSFSNGVPGMALALKDPTGVNLDASIDRVRLADSCGVFNLALDTAETIGAKDATEQMLAHQMAAAHKMSMHLIEKSLQQRDTVEMARLTNAAARLMDTYQKAMLTMNKVRTGGKQTVTVQHVNVQDGGQAVINGAVSTGGAYRRGKVEK